MKKPLYTLAVIALLLAGIAVTGTGCAKKASAPPPAATSTTPAADVPATPPAPTISLTATPAAVERGQSTTISWRTTNATEVSIDGGIGTVEASGTRTVAPSASTTFRARAAGPGGTANAEVRITVTEPADVVPPTTRKLTDAEWFPSTIKDAFFNYDEYDIRPDAREALIGNSQALGERRNIPVLIEGHCDERGSEKYNLALGEKRASAARDFLVARGIDPARIETVSLGEERPFAQGHDEASWQLNRRAHFVMR
ncbi:MAG: pal [Acidobacteria bacterium]|nr:pal [Acidobacteriota bacterium]